MSLSPTDIHFEADAIIMGIPAVYNDDGAVQPGWWTRAVAQPRRRDQDKDWEREKKSSWTT